MRVGVGMRVRVRVRILVMMVVVRGWQARARAFTRAMQVRVTVAMLAATVRAGFRLEALTREAHLKAELSHHVIEHMIVQISQTQRLDLHRNVAIAEVIRRAHQGQRVIRSDDRELFARCFDRDDRAVIREQAVPVAQTRAAIEQERGFGAITQAQETA